MEDILIIVVIVIVETLFIAISIVECIVHSHYNVGGEKDGLIDIARIKYIRVCIDCYILMMSYAGLEDRCRDPFG